ncbi:MAG: methyltransferase domain-containing protein [Actinobacteria bacterium]|nr:MAG: methyltransferase domain-containing protein [Actinomycetota bacterium]
MAPKRERGRHGVGSKLERGTRHVESEPEGGTRHVEFEPEGGTRHVESEPEGGTREVEFEPEGGTRDVESEQERGTRDVESKPLARERRFDVLADLFDFDYPITTDVPFWVEMAKRANFPVLELGCGTGRILVPIAKTGVLATGVDSSARMLELAAKKARAAGVEGRLSFARADMASFSLDIKGYTMCFAARNSFMHLLVKEEQESSLASIRDHLVDGGILGIDVFNPKLEQVIGVRGVVAHDYTKYHPGLKRIITKRTRRTVDPFEQRQHLTYEYDLVSDDKTDRFSADVELRYYFRSELTLLLEKNGFAIEEIFGDYDFSPLRSSSPAMIFIARKT